MFFRGFLGGILLRRLGVWVGSSIQAAAFLLPHLLLLTIDGRLWPILPIQCVVGWILGALRHRSGSVIECAILHAALSTAIGMLVGLGHVVALFGPVFVGLEARPRHYAPEVALELPPRARTSGG
ncbi:CPBP family intramembrane metalloprotease [Corynebacterium hindlerae]|uniref:CPBP family glutamic-type intramembrane protease n=1 Tax=Corynebacterium hindlerae TaxID=699041 RepID=UPI001AD683EE|nr:CPBP family intramembrane metalloprotease [Corynebacterium hindlerae]